MRAAFGSPSQRNPALESVNMQHLIKLLEPERNHSNYLLNNDILSISLQTNRSYARKWMDSAKKCL